MPGEKLLVVEDDRTTASIVQLKLQQLGYEVPSVAASAEEAIKQAEATEPDFVLMDIDLGHGQDGIDAAQIIRERFEIPVIFVTSHSDSETLQRAKATAPFGYINKPLRENDLRTTIELALEKRKQELEAAAKEERRRTVLTHNPEIICDSQGVVLEFNLGARHALKVLEANKAEELLPFNHRQIIDYALRIGNSYVVAGRIQERIFSWEYIPNKQDNSVKVVCEDLTHDRNLSNSQSNEDALKQTLNYLSIGVMLLNRRLEPTFINQAATTYLEKEKHITIIDDKLTLDTIELNSELAKLINNDEDGVLSLSKANPDVHTELLVSPIKSAQEKQPDTLPVSIIFIFHGHKDTERFEEILKGLYRFSKAEARLAAALVQDPRLEQAAASIGIKVNTARSHLKRIFQKTGTDRQSSLINHIVSGPAGIIIKNS